MPLTAQIQRETVATHYTIIQPRRRNWLKPLYPTASQAHAFLFVNEASELSDTEIYAQRIWPSNSNLLSARQQGPVSPTRALEYGGFRADINISTRTTMGEKL
ncbi:Hypothetical_protein [Hexamita inflata]|uniref:Hypothetical_protein n=1 Tax=Hexamita inflata TaxID=28002 RepID=A0ABP1HH91_9EUKA